jgi:flagellar secretion chaperone FliS
MTFGNVLMPNLAGRAANRYRETEAQSRTPVELVVMLYDGALRFIDVAGASIERNDIEARGRAIARALDILSELRSTLDHEKGGDIAESLERLYAYITGRLVDASAKRDTRPLQEATTLLTTLRDGWSEVSRGAPGSARRVDR